MFERFFARDAAGMVKGLTLEWKCPDCAGLNFRILGIGERVSGEYPSHCRYCRAKFRVAFEKATGPVNGETEFYDLLDEEDFTESERTDMIRDFAEIASLKADRAAPGVIQEKEKALQEKIDLAKRRRR